MFAVRRSADVSGWAKRSLSTVAITASSRASCRGRGCKPSAPVKVAHGRGSTDVLRPTSLVSDYRDRAEPSREHRKGNYRNRPGAGGAPGYPGVARWPAASDHRSAGASKPPRREHASRTRAPAPRPRTHPRPPYCHLRHCRHRRPARSDPRLEQGPRLDHGTRGGGRQRRALGRALVVAPALSSRWRPRYPVLRARAPAARGALTPLAPAP